MSRPHPQSLSHFGRGTLIFLPKKIPNGNQDELNRAIATFWFMMSAPMSNGDRP
ncbi:hypothetical protein [Laspinema palackyanum]|uniref:hypothetical protein n=1 Tax=Laspinema palackyanum TaxID=3231601 RepID=UPI00345D33AC|nr:hypothetical protein [Laspinema sp. D2c]